ncbi:MAG: AAA domain-containing protein [Gemmatimonadetes bacterium]|nr:AAA domain-containing protein [Gemmatimonadota bacterium]
MLSAAKRSRSIPYLGAVRNISDEGKVSFMRDKTAGVWARFAVEEGLPDAAIECLYQDRHNRIWLGTSDRGVACFDQKTVGTFTHQEGLSGNRVHSLVEDAAGSMWLGTNRGLTWYDDEGFHPLASSLSYSFLGGSADAEGGVWFGLAQHPHSPPRLAHWDGQQFRLIALTDRAHRHGESISALAVDAEGIIWCGGRSLYSYDRGNDRSHRHARLNEVAPNTEVTGLLPRPDGTLWIATRVGVFIFDGQHFRLLKPSRHTPFLALVENPRSETLYLTSYEGILACCDGERMDFAYRGDLSFSRGLCVDHLGRLWVGTHDRGLYCYDSQRLQVFGPDQGLPATGLTCIAQRDAGPLWTSTQGGLVRFPQQSKAENIAVPDCEKIAALCLDRADRVWFGGTGLYRYDYDGGRLELIHQPASPDAISAITIDECDRVWFAYQRGAGLGYVEDEQVRWFEPATPTQIDVLAWSRQGHLWLGSNSADEKHGLYRFDGTTCIKVDVMPACLIFALCEGADGRLWIGTNQGLWCLNEGRIQSFTQADGLPCDTITSIIQAGDGRLWMGTEGHGLCGHDGQVFQKVEVPGHSFCNTVCALTESRDGALHLATKGGLVRYAPQRIPPQAAIVRVEADATYEVGTDQVIHLPETADSVCIRFEGASPLDPPAHLIYRYRLDGLESEWRQTAATQVEYPPLQPGTYAFCLQAVDRDLTYSKQVTVQLEITADDRMSVLQRWFIGQSPAIRQVEAEFLEAAATDLTVLLLGETGTGKSLAAQAIHGLSARREAPFVAVNCGLLERELINNELFGHEKGAFTGAENRYLGKFEQANQGTLFLDEIGDLTLDVQANLLEVLQERQINRLGGNQALPVDVRVIAATHDDLEQAVAKGTFRTDLFYRIAGLPIRIPSLQERPEDIPLLAEHFASQFASQLKQPLAPIRPAAMEALQAYHWPGNVRQLEHAVERTVLAARHGSLEPDHFIQSIASPYQREAAFAIEPLEDHLRQYLAHVLNHTNGVISGPHGAARLLGVHPNTLRSRLRKLGLPFRKKERKAL